MSIPSRSLTSAKTHLSPPTSVEGNLYQVTRNRNGVLPIQGADVTNLGDGKSDTIATVGVGFEVRPINNVAVRAAWEKNVTHPSDLLDSRVTVSAIISF